jgi:hypothetical protein
MTVYSSYLSLNGHQNDWMINIKEWREMNSSVSTDLHDYVKEEMSSSDAHFHIFANDIFNLNFLLSKCFTNHDCFPCVVF